MSAFLRILTIGLLGSWAVTGPAAEPEDRKPARDTAGKDTAPTRPPAGAPAGTSGSVNTPASGGVSSGTSGLGGGGARPTGENTITETSGSSGQAGGGAAGAAR